MKTKILLASGSLVALATTLGVGTALLASDHATVARLASTAYVLVTGSIGLFLLVSFSLRK